MTSFASGYLSQRGLQDKTTVKNIQQKAGIIVVIPAFYELELSQTLYSLKQARLPNEPVLVIVVINHPAGATKEVKAVNKDIFLQIEKWIVANSTEALQFCVLFRPDLDVKHAGVGLARKIGMDTACAIFNDQGRENGVIVALDADTTVSEDYFCAIEKHFIEHTYSPAANIYFEHPCTQNIDDPLNRHILEYELHLRYYVEAQRFCNLPYAYHTVGSAFCVRASVYSKEGGMNRKKAGEDFYFLQKIFRLGNFTEINTTTIYPSARTSFRVPFGTGASALKYVNNSYKALETYNLLSFRHIKQWVDGIAGLYNADQLEVIKYLEQAASPLHLFLKDNNATENIREIQHNSASLETFIKRFYTWFNGFRLMRFLNDSHPEYYTNSTIEKESQKLLKTLEPNGGSKNTLIEILQYYRNRQKSGTSDLLSTRRIK